MGLLEAQIRQVETVALPIVQSLLTRPAPMLDVRDEIAQLKKSLKAADRRISRMLNAGIGTRSRKEASARITLAAVETDADHDVLAQAQSHVQRLLGTVEHAYATLPREQRRNRTASPDPVRFIDDALLHGFHNGHPKGKPLPPYTLKRSYSPNSPYRRIIGLCYAAVGHENSDPERAIRAFIAWRTRATAIQRAALGVKDSPRKPKNGRQVRKKT